MTNPGDCICDDRTLCADHRADALACWAAAPPPRTVRKTGPHVMKRNRSVWQGKPCHYCQAPAECVDHYIPLSRGGPDDLRNLVPACRSCNRKKHITLGWRPEEG